MSEPKTRPTDASVDEFLDAVPNERRREDARAVDAMMRAATGAMPVMWGTAIVGYGDVAAEDPTRTSWPVVAFAPRKRELVLYLDQGIEPEAFEDLGLHRRGVGCVYIKRLDAIDRDVLIELIRRSIDPAGS